MKLTGGQVVARALKEYGVEYVAGVPGHGIWSLFDAFLEEGSQLPFIQVMHEQSAVHLADGYFRAGGRPMACSTSVGPGATNTIIGLATAYADSTSLFYVSGSPQTYMHGHGTMQEIERQQDNAFPRITEQVTKRAWQAGSVQVLPSIMHRAFNEMLTGRPGPVHVEVPMDVQVGVLSSSGRRFLEVLGKLDQLMPLLQTLEIHEVISAYEVDIQRAALKRQVREVANGARNFAMGLRRRMNALGSRDEEVAAIDAAPEAAAETDGAAAEPTQIAAAEAEREVAVEGDTEVVSE